MSFSFLQRHCEFTVIALAREVGFLTYSSQCVPMVVPIADRTTPNLRRPMKMSASDSSNSIINSSSSCSNNTRPCLVSSPRLSHSEECVTDDSTCPFQLQLQQRPRLHHPPMSRLRLALLPCPFPFLASHQPSSSKPNPPNENFLLPCIISSLW